MSPARRGTAVALAAAAVAVAACGTPTEPGEPISLDPVARPLVEQILADASAAIWYGARFSDATRPPHLAFGGWLLSRDERYYAHVSLATTNEGAYEPYCSGDIAGDEGEGFWATHSTCSRLRIENGAYFVDLYFTEGMRHLPEDRHELVYQAEQGPAGSVVYSRNPLTTWRYDFHADGSHELQVAVDTEVRFEPVEGDEIRLEYAGTLYGALDPSGSVVTTLVELEFPLLTACSVPLKATVEDDGHAVEGHVVCDEELVARITHPGEEFVFEWVEP